MCVKKKNLRPHFGLHVQLKAFVDRLAAVPARLFPALRQRHLQGRLGKKKFKGKKNSREKENSSSSLPSPPAAASARTPGEKTNSSVRACVCIHACAYIHTYAYVHACVCIRMHTYIRMHTCAYVCMHTYTHSPRRSTAARDRRASTCPAPPWRVHTPRGGCKKIIKKIKK